VFDDNASSTRQLGGAVAHSIPKRFGKSRIVEDPDLSRRKKSRYSLRIAGARQRAGDDDPVVAGEHPGEAPAAPRISYSKRCGDRMRVISRPARRARRIGGSPRASAGAASASVCARTCAPLPRLCPVRWAASGSSGRDAAAVVISMRW
jgi:hypothetical protein